ncbi:serine hydrolase domain-containing protein, partial [Steroidobacter sp.]|uniref:serine hydrolase domain-containing protein n=1 Tax=Steroidobacter sp. TaxID=1978227 RepID=UPI001A622FE5
MLVRSLVAVACLVALTACSPSLDTTETQGNQATVGQHTAEIDALFSEQTQPGSPGAAVGVYHHGQLVFAKGYGLADVEAGTPITPQTRFHVASVSKQFAAFSVALLAKEGKLDLDADVRTYLPYVPDFGRKITVR